MQNFLFILWIWFCIEQILILMNKISAGADIPRSKDAETCQKYSQYFTKIWIL